MKALEIKNIENEMNSLYVAMKNKTLSVNDYCTMYHSLAQKLKSLKNK